ncbi:winged helix-turn-helix domain-containing protein [Paraglaciecola sp. 2405UD69-4]|uniref:winged helix-turn-helix domain-containing protein n=1 Tax=Paraglaciecola sp. 2405UD69-4 TaxID=3391836 RepID=UPI0039C9B79E
MTEFKIGSCTVDVSRCQINVSGKLHTIEPKVMDVLAFLYSYKNQVVSQQDIFKAIWGNAIFNPSSVQRSIAILRKIIELDTKSPEFILTHPKRGYSLAIADLEPDTNPPSVMIFVSLVVALIFAIGALITWDDWFEPAIKLDFSLLKPLTSSEASESNLVLSPGMDVVAFVRIGKNKKNHIWIKKLSTGEERQITKNATKYTKLGWSKDGSSLAFLELQKSEELLRYLTIDPYQLSATKPVTLTSFKEWQVNNLQLQWSTTGYIYFSTDNGGAVTQLKRISVRTKEIQILKTFNGNEQLQLLALSPDDSQLALVFDVHQNRYRIDLFTIENREMTRLRVIENNIHGISWHPGGQALLVSNRDKLKLIDKQGRLTNIDFDNFHYIRNAQYTTDGNEIMMELVSMDIDIMYSELASPEDYQMLVDTQSLDFLPIYAPDDSRFVFESHRNGLKQLFIYENGQERLVFTNPKNEDLFGVVWSSDGSQIITASKDTLFIVEVALAKYKEVKHDFGPFYLWESYFHENAVLVSRKTDEGIKPVKFNIDTKTLTLLFDSPENFECVYMGLDNQDTLYVSDNSKIYATKDGQELEVYWQSNGGNVEGFTLAEDYFSVKVANTSGFELIKVDPISLSETQLLTQEYGNNMFLTNANINADKFLFSRVKDIKQLVRLR